MKRRKRRKKDVHSIIKKKAQINEQKHIMAVMGALAVIFALVANLENWIGAIAFSTCILCVLLMIRIYKNSECLCLKNTGNVFILFFLIGIALVGKEVWYLEMQENASKLLPFSVLGVIVFAASLLRIEKQKGYNGNRLWLGFIVLFYSSVLMFGVTYRINRSFDFYPVKQYEAQVLSKQVYLAGSYRTPKIKTCTVSIHYSDDAGIKERTMPIGNTQYDGLEVNANVLLEEHRGFLGAKYYDLSDI